MARALAQGAVAYENGQLQVKDEALMKEIGLTEDVLKSYRNATEETISEL
jgi:hypothetical protein